MKITVNGSVKTDTIDKFLNEAKEKQEKINTFCKANKIKELHWKDAELEYEYKEEFTKPKPKIETRVKGG